MKKQLITAVVAVMSVLSAGAQDTYANVSAPLEQRVEDALSQMTLAEKVNLCHATSKFYSPGVPRLGIPGLWSSDGPHGVRMEMAAQSWDYAYWSQDSCTAFPSLTCLAATWNTDLARLYGTALGEEARFRGKNVMLGPGVNIARTPLNGRNFEYMGEDPMLAASLCVPYIQGVQSNGVAACVKHFCLNNQEWQRWTIDSRCSERALNEIYLPAFKAAVQKGGVWSLMGSYNKVDGTHASHNDHLLNGILKRQWGFDGAVMSDWDATHNLMEAINGGLDLEMGTSSRPDKGLRGRSFTFAESYLGNDFLRLLSEGKVSEDIVNDKARRVLRLIFRTAMDGRSYYGNQDYAAHSKVCRAIGNEGAVLLRNEGSLLPFNPQKYNKILVVGDNAVRRLTELGGSSELKVQHETSPLAALQARFGEKIIYAHGYEAGRTFYDHEENITKNVTDSLRAEAVALAKDADLVIFVGGLNKNKHQDCEDADRRNYDLPYGQNELLRELVAANPRLISIFMGGTPARIPGFDKADRFARPLPAILWAWYLGSDGGDALCDLLLGEECPSGRLPVTFPCQLSDTPAAHYGEVAYPGKDGHVDYLEDILVGYRWYDTKAIAPRYPFGYGLSYTSFRYSNLSLSSNSIADGGKLTVKCTVQNTGAMDGKEVAQLYIAAPRSKALLRPAKELKGFAKHAVARQQSQEFTFELSADDFKYYDEATHQWTLAPGNYEILVGSSSRDIHLKAKVRVGE